ncbi:MAG: beta-glucosidase BglX [Clostridia bacterium]|nr:beta-glucosidase BglX [Clostridia bacterium]
MTGDTERTMNMKTEELKKLFDQLSLKEKIGQMVQIPGYFLSEGNITGPALDMGLTQEDIDLAGSVLSVIGADRLKAIQTAYMEKHPHHIPMLFMADIINGYRTVFPIPLAQGCSFDPALAENGAAIAAEEAAAAGIHVTFSPMADLSRDARWGRVMESTGEDPYLNGLMASAMVQGYQGMDHETIPEGKLAACLKHYAGYGAPTAGRDYNTVELSARTLREDYLPAYQRAVEAGCDLVMTSFNTLDRIPSSANRWLLREVLRDEMGFDGVVISDWAAIHELVEHGIAADDREAAKLAVLAGVDIDMASPAYCRNLLSLVKDGEVPESLIDEAAWRILVLKNRLGLFENPYKDASAADETAKILSDAHRAAARKAAADTFVLLKNDNALLPIRQEERIGCIGPYADRRQLSGSWSIFADDSVTETLREAFSGDANVRFAKGCSILDPGAPRVPFGAQKIADEPETDADAALEEALRLAADSDKVILTLGEPNDYSGEAASRANLTLPECQQRLLRETAKVNPNIVVILFCGRPLDIRPVKELAGAILVAWFPGTEGALALTDVLTGKTAPSGKLAMSFPYCVGQTPVFYAQLSTGRPFHGDFRTDRFHSKYLDIPNEPLYPFGYGLTYTSFECSAVTLNKAVMEKSDTIHACVTLANTGSVKGTETVQLYIHDCAASVARPVREMKAFKKVTLSPGESKNVEFVITEEMLRFHDIGMNFVSEPGRFEVFIGSDSTTENKAVFELK